MAIGGFDGVHLGHRAVIEKATRVLVIEKGGNLTPGRERGCHIPHPLIFWELSKLKQLEPEEFLVLIRKKFGRVGIVVGEDFRFGAERKGNLTLLQKFFPVKIIPPVKVEGVEVHSQVIRTYFKKGEIGKGNRLLGRPYRIWGRKVKGQGLGQKKLLPTINLKIELPFLLPRQGVYATRLETFPSLTFIGNRSTDGKFAIEVHLLGKWREMETGLESEWGKVECNGKLHLSFLHFIRPVEKFKGLGELKRRLERDLGEGYSYFEGEI